MSEKEKYFDSLREFETTELFLTNTTDLVNDEIENNCVLISISAELAKQTSSTDFITFLNRVKTNRRQQLQESSLDVNLIYYLWLTNKRDIYDLTLSTPTMINFHLVANLFL